MKQDPMMTAIYEREGCQWLGPEVDPLRDWGKYTCCGQKVISGSAWCADHYWRVYRKGSAIAGKTKAKEIDAEIEELKRLEEIAAILETEDE
jgi:hypothetical protein